MNCHIAVWTYNLWKALPLPLSLLYDHLILLKRINEQLQRAFGIQYGVINAEDAGLQRSGEHHRGFQLRLKPDRFLGEELGLFAAAALVEVQIVERVGQGLGYA